MLERMVRLEEKIESILTVELPPLRETHKKFNEFEIAHPFKLADMVNEIKIIKKMGIAILIFVSSSSPELREIINFIRDILL